MTVVSMTLRIEEKMKAAIEAIAAAEGGSVNARINRFIWREIFRTKIRAQEDLRDSAKTKHALDWALEVANASPEKCVFAEDAQDEFSAEILFAVADEGDTKGRCTVPNIHRSIAYNAEHQQELQSAISACNDALAEIGGAIVNDDGTLSEKARSLLPTKGPGAEMLKRILRENRLSPAPVISGKAPINADAMQDLYLFLEVQEKGEK